MNPAWMVLAVGSGATGCEKEDDSGEPARGEFVCQMTREECVALFQGTYAGSYRGSATGSWSIFITADGTVEGTVVTSDGATLSVAGEVDETGWVEFGSSSAPSFAGAIEFDDDLAGKWSDGSASGSFSGALISRDQMPPGSDGSGAGNNGGGGTGSDAENTGGGGSGGGATAGDYCDRLIVLLTDCQMPIGSGECSEPTTEEEVCQAECMLDLTCTELTELDPLMDCADACAPADPLDYCARYQNKLVECGLDSTLLMLDICSGTTELPTTTTCTWECVIAAPCDELADEQALYDECTAVCGA